MIPIYEIIIRLLLGALIGGIIGFEREIHGRAAGFRTQLIVCVAAVLIMIISENYYHYIRDIDQSIRIDPARISAGAIIGIGFLGAGVIIKSGYAVRGLTTAASLWIVSAIGLAIGAGLYFEGMLTALITIIALILLRVLENRIKPLRYKNIFISTPAAEDPEAQITSLLEDIGLHIHSIDYEKNRTADELVFHYTVSTRDRKIKGQTFKKLCSLDFITRVKISG
jgi:putative Mg2+ transporter-C (MgtC) family protein